MKYMLVVIFVCSLLIIGCAAREPMEVASEQPELVSMVSLPPLTSDMYADGTRFNVLLHVMEDGTVEYVRMLGSSGDADWDVKAVESIKQWHFATPRRDGQPTDLWFRQLIIVQIQEPVMMAIGELVCNSKQEADSLYALIRTSNNMDYLFDDSIVTVNVMQYPQRVREELKTLGEREISTPIRMGDKYVIYKRFPHKASKSPAL